MKRFNPNCMDSMSDLAAVLDGASPREIKAKRKAEDEAWKLELERRRERIAAARNAK